MSYRRKTKIVTTLGLSTNTEQDLEGIIKAGANVARLNFSHGTHEEHRARLHIVRHISDQLDLPVAIMQDLSGPKIRIGDFTTETINLQTGTDFILTTEEIEGDEKRVTIKYPTLPQEINVDNTIFLDDGKLHLDVTKISGSEIHCKVVAGGTI